MTPLTQLQAIMAGAGSIAPVHAAVGSVLDEVEPGRAVARVPSLPRDRLRGPGVVPVLADFALSAAITSALPGGLRISTLTLHTAMLGPLPAPGSALVASADLVGTPAATAVSRCVVASDQGVPVAHLTARCAVLPTAAEHLPLFHGEVDPDPFVALGPDLRAAPGLANSAGGVQGGVLAAVLGHRIAEAVPAATAYDLDVTFVRAVPADDAGMAVDVVVQHCGRRFAAAGARLHDAGGRLATLASAACWLDG